LPENLCFGFFRQLEDVTFQSSRSFNVEFPGARKLEEHVKTPLVQAWLGKVRNHPGTKLFKILNLGIGLSCSLVIIFWISDQLDFDRLEANTNNIYRLEQTGWVGLPAFFPGYLGQVPEIKETLRVNAVRPRAPILHHQQKHIELPDFKFVDKNFLRFFAIPMIHGDPQTALEEPDSIVLTDKAARRIFGNENPLGKSIRFNGSYNLQVTGIIREQAKFHIKIDALAQINALPVIHENKAYFHEDRWNTLVYFSTRRDVDQAVLEDKINALLASELPARFQSDKRFLIRPFGKIYFAANLQNEPGVRHGNPNLIVIFTLISLAILFIACLNHINITLAHSALYTKQVCIRKVVGASRKDIILNSMRETLGYVLLAFLLAALLIFLGLPHFRRLVSSSLELDFFSRFSVFAVMLIAMITCLGAGLFPALKHSAITPMALFKGITTRGKRQRHSRNVLMIAQFAVSIVLVIGSLTVIDQLDFMKTRDLGFSPENIVHIELKRDLGNHRKALLRNHLLDQPGVLQVSYSDGIFGQIANVNTWKVNGEAKPMNVINADPGFIPLMGLVLDSGRNFSRGMHSDQKKRVIINQAAAKHLGMDQPVGKTVQQNFGNSEIIGVLRDFHFNSLHNQIEPLGICWFAGWARHLIVKLSGRSNRLTLDRIRMIMREYMPDSLFNYRFLSDSFGQQYHKEKNLASTMIYYSLIALLLSFMGLFSMSVFVAARKTKEIAIRKIHGARPRDIVTLLSGVFSRWVLLANIIAWPVAYFIMSQWLMQFAYKTRMKWETFLISGVSALVVAVLTVSMQTIRASRLRSVEALKHE